MPSQYPRWSPLPSFTYPSPTLTLSCNLLWPAAHKSAAGPRAGNAASPTIRWHLKIQDDTALPSFTYPSPTLVLSCNHLGLATRTFVASHRVGIAASPVIRCHLKIQDVTPLPSGNLWPSAAHESAAGPRAGDAALPAIRCCVETPDGSTGAISKTH